MDCIFCKIVAGELPCDKVYEDKRALAFLDINPVNKGHLLVIPKDHFTNMFDAPADILKDLIVLCQRLAKTLTEVLGVKGFNLAVNNGPVAGQVVGHLHFHIIPRFEGDNLHLWSGKNMSEDEMKRTAESIKKLINTL